MTQHKQYKDMLCCYLKYVATIFVRWVESIHETPERLHWIHKVVNKTWVKYQFWVNYPFKVFKAHPIISNIPSSPKIILIMFKRLFKRFRAHWLKQKCVYKRKLWVSQLVSVCLAGESGEGGSGEKACWRIGLKVAWDIHTPGLMLPLESGDCYYMRGTESLM